MEQWRGVLEGWCCWPDAKLLERSRQGSALVIPGSLRACPRPATWSATCAHLSPAPFTIACAPFAYSAQMLRCNVTGIHPVPLHPIQRHLTSGRAIAAALASRIASSQYCHGASFLVRGIAFPADPHPHTCQHLHNCPQALVHARTTHAQAVPRRAILTGRRRYPMIRLIATPMTSTTIEAYT